MPAQNIEARVLKIASELFGVELSTVTPDKSLVHDLRADSIDQVEFVMNIEDEFGVEVPDEIAETFTTPQHAIDYLNTNT